VMNDQDTNAETIDRWFPSFFKLPGQGSEADLPGMFLYSS